MFCTQCGQQNPSDARFCARCGAQLLQDSDLRGGDLRGGDQRENPPGGETPSDTTSALSVAALEHALEGAHSASEVREAGQAAEGEEAGTLEGLPPGSALLVVKRGPNAGSRFLLDADLTTAGRHPDSDIFLDDVTVSRRHARFVREGGGFVVRDVGSLNGTYLNRERIESAVLAGGDEVQIGKYRLVFLAGPTAGEVG